MLVATVGLSRDVLESNLKLERLGHFRLVGIVRERREPYFDLPASCELQRLLQPVAPEPLRTRPVQLQKCEMLPLGEIA